MSSVVATALELADLTTWPPISSLPQIGSLHRWSCRRSHNKFYTLNPKLLAKFARNESTVFLPAHDPKASRRLVRLECKSGICKSLITSIKRLVLDELTRICASLSGFLMPGWRNWQTRQT